MAKKGKYSSDQTSIQNAAKTLKANIQFASVDNPVQSLVLTSSVPDEGKSTIAINLAQSIAQGGKSVLLVECDMRRRSLASMLGVHSKAGIYAVLTDQATLDEAVLPLSQSYMYFLDSEPHIPNPADVLSSKRFKKLLGTLEAKYDYVIFDTPPVGAFIDAAILAQLVDATVFVVRRDFTKRDAVVHAFEQLKKSGANVIGTVLNYAETNEGSYYYYSYNQGSKKVGDVQGSTVHVSGGRSGSASESSPSPASAPRHVNVSGAAKASAGKRFSR